MAANDDWRKARSIYDFSVKDIDDKEVDLSKYKSKVLLIVNVASNCSLSKSNYRDLNALFEKYRDQGFMILGFPSDSFGQEPCPGFDIKEFMKKNGVKWDAFSKISVNGERSSPLYKYLKNKVGGSMGDFIKWNYTKFIVNRDGIPVNRFGPTTKASDYEKYIKNELAIL